ncbi:MAG: DUF4294 domain-containing protein [Bacteroidales bacterium]|nr:DUF4294 domain-containing protein [Bacteroidales bacterium]
MKRFIHIVLLLLVLSPVSAGAQGHVRKAMEKARQRQEAMAKKQVSEEQGKPQSAGYMQMVVTGSDTTYFDRLTPIWIMGRRKGTSDKAWRDYYKLVYRFARVYPYALSASEVLHKADSVITARNYGVVKRDRYINDVQDQLFKSYEKAFRQMTIYEGALLMKLIDRESGMSSYEIIKVYKSGAAAGFWQGVAKLFENDLKSRYDPQGDDKDTELLVRAWQAGEFPSLYWSVFWENPPEITIKPIKLD